jgi:hypothetical protein
LNWMGFGVYPVVRGPVSIQLLFPHHPPPAVPHVAVAKPLLFQFIRHGLAVPVRLGPFHAEVDEVDEADEVAETPEATEPSVEDPVLGSYGNIVQVMRLGWVEAGSKLAGSDANEVESDVDTAAAVMDQAAVDMELFDTRGQTVLSVIVIPLATEIPPAVVIPSVMNPLAVVIPSVVNPLAVVIPSAVLASVDGGSGALWAAVPASAEMVVVRKTVEMTVKVSVWADWLVVVDDAVLDDS